METRNDVRKEARALTSADDAPVQETPEDVAVLYSWANVHGAKYRDFSASRREYRAQMRRRMTEQQAREAGQRAIEEAKIAVEAEVTAAAAAVKAETDAHMAAQAAAEAEDAARTAAREEARAHAEMLARAQERAKTKIQSEAHKQQTAGSIVDTLEDPYHTSGHALVEHPTHVPGVPVHTDSAQEVAAVGAASSSLHAQTSSLAQRIAASAPLQNPAPVRAAASSAVQSRAVAQATPSGSFPHLPINPPARQSWTEPTQIPQQAQSFYTPAPAVHEPFYSQPEPMRTAMPSKQEHAIPQGRPAWLHESESAVAAARMQSSSPLADTLQQSRERVASRWFALKGVFEGATGEQTEAQPVRQNPPRTPVLAVFSLAGGVGKTSIVATLGRALSSLGEKTLLTDTTSYGLLPFYFGARELRPGVVRTFAPPSGSTDAPINLVNLDTDTLTAENASAGQDWLSEEISRSSRGANRVVVDLATASGSLTRRILRMGPIVLVPVAPDLNSVISIAAVEQFFQSQTDADGRAIKVFYLLNQFDASQPLHLDVREVLRQQLGDRLLPFVIRRSQAISEALAEGMTVMDYAPNSPVAEDYMNLAAWVRNVSAPASLAFRGVRWSEQR